MNHRIRIPVIILAGILLIICGGNGQSAAQSKPNILFIFSDDHALQAISVYGSAINETPNIDRIANEGMLFRHAMVENSICAPSRAAVLTGTYSHRHGIIDNGSSFDSTQTTFPKLLQNAGYQTAMIGKWHLKSQPTGFDFWKVLPGQGQYYNPRFITQQGSETQQGYVTDLVTNEALDWLKNMRDKDQPFLMMYQQKAPHRKWIPGPDHLDMYDGRQMPEPATLFDDYKGRASGAKNQKMEIGDDLDLIFDSKVFQLIDSTNLGQYRPYKREMYDRLNESQWQNLYEAYKSKNEDFLKQDLEGKELTKWKYQRYIKDYLRSIASLDDNIGRVLDYLEEAGLKENTIVVYSSDQGFYLGEHGWFDKRWMYEESLHMPLIIRWPGITKPRSENKDMVMNIDFAETFLDIAGVEIPKRMQGRSLKPLLKGETPDDWREEIYYHYYESPGPHDVPKHYGIRNERFKLINYYELEEWEFFDLQKDPHEMQSRYNDPAYADKISSMKEELENLQQQYNDTSFVK